MDDYLELLYKAKDSPMGILVDYSGDYDRNKDAFYRARRKAQDPDLESLQIRRGPFGIAQLYIIRTDVVATTAGKVKAPNAPA